MSTAYPTIHDEKPDQVLYWRQSQPEFDALLRYRIDST